MDSFQVTDMTLGDLKKDRKINEGKCWEYQGRHKGITAGTIGALNKIVRAIKEIREGK